MTRKFSAVIIEDDAVVVEQLSDFLNQTQFFEPPFICKTSLQALTLLQKQNLDLIFLDMELPDMSGLELLKLFPNHAPTIAMSAYPNYAIDCYDNEVRDFMPKPLTYSRLLRSIQRTVLKTEMVSSEAVPTPIPALQHTSSPYSVNKSIAPLPANKPTETANLPDYIYLKTGRKTERFAYTDILYFEAYTLYAKLITKNGTFVINESLGSLDRQLNSNQFVRVHKSYIINLRLITQFSSNMIWVGVHKIPIGVTFKDKVEGYLKGLRNSLS